MTVEQAATVNSLVDKKENASSKAEKKKAASKLAAFHERHVDHTVGFTQQLEEQTGVESRLTILGHLQRGGTPSAADRLLATRLGTACAEMLKENIFGVMVAARGDSVQPVPLEEVAGKKNLIPSGSFLDSFGQVGGNLYGRLTKETVGPDHDYLESTRKQVAISSPEFALRLLSGRLLTRSGILQAKTQTNSGQNP